MLIDRCIIEVRSGKGGDGAISFLRDKQTMRGGPDGGNGGRGGSIYFVGKSNLNNLYNFRHSRTFIAEDGEKGMKTNRYGHNAEDIIIEVPVGTIITEESSGRVLADIKVEGQKVLAAKGGRGGRGNACFKSSRHRIPKIAENGHPGERKRLILELKLLADAGLVGFPSVGKSTFLNVVSKANVPTADYPFTTLIPNLGVCYLPDGKSFVLADMPGLIKGAHEGKGLGIQFLRHIERTRILIHMVSMSGERDPYEDYLAINEELKQFNAFLEKRPQIVVATKMDVEGAAEIKAEFDKKLGFESLALSSLTHEGVNKLLKLAMETIEATPEFPIKGVNEETKMKIYNAREIEGQSDYKVIKGVNGWIIKGEKVERDASLINTSTDEGIMRLIRYLDNIGIEERLEEAGAKDGDKVQIGDFVFDYTD